MMINWSNKSNQIVDCMMYQMNSFENLLYQYEFIGISMNLSLLDWIDRDE